MSTKNLAYNVARGAVRKVLGVRDGEPIRDARYRRQIEKLRKADHVEYGQSDQFTLFKILACAKEIPSLFIQYGALFITLRVMDVSDKRYGSFVAYV